MEGKIITLNNLIKYNEKRDEVVVQKIQNTIPAEDSYITYVVKNADGNKKLYSTKFKYNIANAAITTDSGTSIISLKNGIVNITAATANINTIYAKTGYIDNISAKQVTVDDLISTQATIKTLSLVETDSPIASFAYSEENVVYNQVSKWESVGLQFISTTTKGNMFFYGTFTAKSTKDCWFRIECNSNIQPKTINVTQLSQTINTNCNAPVAFIENNFIYIGIKGAIDSKFNFTCFF